MNRHKGSVNVIIIFLVGALIASALYWFRPLPKTRPPVTTPPPSVSVMAVNPQSHTLSVDTQGAVEPRRAIKLIAEVSGKVTSVHPHFIDGREFAKNDTLVAVDDRDYQYRLVEAKAQVAVAARELALEKGQARQAKREWRDLGSKEANALSLRAPQVNAAQSQLASAQAQRNLVQLNVQRTAIVAPFKGRVDTRYVDVGQYVTAGTTIADIYDSENAEVRLPLSDQQLAFLGLPLGTVFDESEQRSITLSANLAGEQRQWQASLIRTESTVDATTRFYTAVAKVRAPFDVTIHAYPLVMGLFVDAVIEGVTLDAVISLPEKSVIKNQWVYVVDNNRIQQRAIQIVGSDGSSNEGHILVRGDLVVGDQVVISDPRVLRPDMQVSVQANVLP
jgi:RND family efflux transporter MFP subunit